MQSDFEVNLMMGFIATEALMINENELSFGLEQSSDKHHRDLKDVRISSNDGKAIKELLSTIQNSKNNPPKDIQIFSVDMPTSNTFVPVIYQPRIDAWNYFLREVNVSRNSTEEYEITLVFEDEVLRKHVLFQFLYRFFRLVSYRRTKDIEAFYIDPKNESFRFPGIYSGDDTLFDDSTHYDKEGDDGSVKYRKIKYYFQDRNHPIVFVNTSNHALAPHDNNHDFWKWEYTPWIGTIPIKLGNKTREETEKAHKQF